MTVGAFLDLEKVPALPTTPVVTDQLQTPSVLVKTSSAPEASTSSAAADFVLQGTG